MAEIAGIASSFAGLISVMEAILVTAGNVYGLTGVRGDRQAVRDLEELEILQILLEESATIFHGSPSVLVGTVAVKLLSRCHDLASNLQKHIVNPKTKVWRSEYVAHLLSNLRTSTVLLRDVAREYALKIPRACVWKLT